MSSMSRRRASLALGAVFLAAIAARAAVVGIDLGSDRIGAAVRRPGAFEVVEDEQSDRRTPAAFGWSREGRRLFGEPALKVLMKSPENVVVYPQETLGRKPGHPGLAHVARHATYELLQPEGAARVTLRAAGRDFTPEEAQGMLLRRLRGLAGKAAGGPVRDAVLTVGPWTTEHERRALLDAAAIAGVNVLSLVNSPVSFAVSYAIERATNGTQKLAFVDMGHASFKIALITITQTLDKRNKTSTTLLVNDIDWDYELGGRDFDAALAEHLLKEVEKSWGSEAAKDPRMRSRVLDEARDAKEVLSVNKAARIKFESVSGDRDLEVSVTRDLFNSLVSGLASRVAAPISRALARANWTTNDVEMVQIVGGGVRVPIVQEALLAAFGKTELFRHVSGDEGAMFGAAYAGALLSSSFRMPEFYLRDITPYGTIASSLGYDASLFKAGTRIGAKKTLTVRSTADMVIDVSYDKQSFALAGGAGACRAVSRFSISGVPTEKDYNLTDTPTVHAYFKLSNSGLVELDRAEAEVSVISYVEEVVKKNDTKNDTKDKPEESNKPQEAQDANAKPQEETTEKDEAKEAKETTEKDEAEAAPNAEEAKEAESEDAKAAEPAPAPEVVKVLKPVKRIHRVTLKVKRESQCIKDLSPADIKASTAKLDALDAEDAALHALEEARNKLETYCYEARDKIDTEREEYEKVAAPGELDNHLEAISAASEWLEMDSEGADVKEFKKRLDTLKKTTDRLAVLRKEAELRPSWPAFVEYFLNISRLKLANISVELEITENESTHLSQQFNEFEEWFAGKQREQAALQPFDDPAYVGEDIHGFIKDLQASLRRLSLRPIKKPAKPEKEEAVENKTEAEPESGAEKAPEGMEVPEATEAPENPQAEKDETKEKAEL